MTQTIHLNTGVVSDYGEQYDHGEGHFFLEEPCHLDVVDGFGFLQVDFGECIGPHGRYKILRKLGWGLYCNGWLAKDTAQDRFVTITALTGHATSLFKKGLMYDLDVLHRISTQGKRMTETHCVPVESHFIQHGGKAAESDHFCLVTKPLGPAIDELAYHQQLSIPCVKRIFRDILKGLNYLHDLGIVHTDINAGAIMVDIGEDSKDFDIQSYIEKYPPRKHPLKETYSRRHFFKETYRDDECREIAVSQPFRGFAFRDWQSRSFIIDGFGGAQFINRRVTEDVSEIELRAPEVVLGLPWNEKIDIWSFGCLAFEFLSDWHLFDVVEDGWDAEKVLLHQMLSFTGERFSTDAVNTSKRGTKFLNPDTGLLKDGTEPMQRRLSDMVRSVRLWKKEPAIDGFEILLQKCLRLDPKERPSAKELLQDPWLNANA